MVKLAILLELMKCNVISEENDGITRERSIEKKVNSSV